MTTDFVSQRRRLASEFGRAHRETLVAEWMRQTRTTTRPLLREIVDELVEDILGARLRDEVLPLDRFAQTERVNGRVEVSLNSRIGEMPRVKNIAGIRYAAEWHETIHVVRDFPAEVPPELRTQVPLNGFDVDLPQLVVCRGYSNARGGEEKAREFFAENAGVAAAICPEDLARCPEYQEFLELASRPGDLGKNGWRLLYRTADFIGVNGPLLSRFWEQQGFVSVSGGSLIAQPKLEGSTRG